MNRLICGRCQSTLRQVIKVACLGALLATTARAGKISSAAVLHAQAVQGTASVSIQKADPWSAYWVKALKNHTLNLSGPKVHTTVAFAADGSVAPSPFVSYMTWRESLNPKRFDSFHTELAKVLRKVKTPTSSGTPPESIIPPSGSTPILPPNFTPDTPTQGLIPPNTPEPSTGVIAAGLIAAGLYVRKRRQG
jgi:hypothetical protein